MKKEDIKYIEHYVIPGASFYHIANGDIFSPEREILPVYHGGCGVGHGQTIQEAREIVYNNAKKNLMDDISELKDKIKIREKSLKVLGDDAFNLGVFRNPDYHGYECNYFNGKKG